MKIAQTHIVGVAYEHGSVSIRFRPAGADSADEPLTVTVTPHATFLYLNLSHAEFEHGSNCQILPIKPII